MRNLFWSGRREFLLAAPNARRRCPGQRRREDFHVGGAPPTRPRRGTWRRLLPVRFHPDRLYAEKRPRAMRRTSFLVGPEGIEPSTRPPQGRVLPLYYGPLRPFVGLMMLYLFAFVNGAETKGPRGVVQVSALSSRTVPPQCREPDGRDVRPRDSAALCGVHPRTSLRVRRSVAGIR